MVARAEVGMTRLVELLVSAPKTSLMRILAAVKRGTETLSSEVLTGLRLVSSDMALRCFNRACNGAELARVNH